MIDIRQYPDPLPRHVEMFGELGRGDGASSCCPTLGPLALFRRRDRDIAHCCASCVCVIIRQCRSNGTAEPVEPNTRKGCGRAYPALDPSPKGPARSEADLSAFVGKADVLRGAPAGRLLIRSGPAPHAALVLQHSRLRCDCTRVTLCR